ncbi:MAG: UDP-3-O-(3-hydroxymyristoyl)glucosamine N-acyltransferase [Flavobacteriaceae bacterium]
MRNFAVMKLTAQEIGKKYNGKVVGSSSVVINQLAKIESAPKGSLTFLANSKYEPFLKTTQASIVLVNQKQKQFSSNTTLIEVEDPYKVFCQLLIEWANQNKEIQSGIHRTAIIDDSAKIEGNVYVGPFVYIGENCKIHENVSIGAYSYLGNDVHIGKGSVIHQRVTLLKGTQIGNECILHSGVVIGSDGFGFVAQGKDTAIKIPQVGNVILGDKVEIGANSTIDRATLGNTILHDGVKLDNLVQIAHNVEIGPRTLIAAQSGIAGSTKIGSDCVIGGQVGIIGHLKLGDNIKIQGQTGVINNVPSGSTIQGTPGFDFRSFYKSYTVFKNLPELKNKVERVEKNMKL